MSIRCNYLNEIKKEERTLNIREKRIKIAREIGFKDEKLFDLIRTSLWDSIIQRAIEIDPEKARKVLMIFAEDKSNGARYGIAISRNTPVEVLQQLAENEDWNVRRAVAGNLNIPIEIQEQLAKDENCHVRNAVANNWNTSIEILKQLAKDKYHFVSSVAKSSLEKK